MAATVAISSIDYSAYAARLASHRFVMPTAKGTAASATATGNSARRQEAASVSISPAARERYAALLAGGQGADEAAATEPDTAETPGTQSPAAVRTPDELTEEERQVVQELRAIDSAVRAHEQAHQTAGGRYAGAPSYSYTNGPDNRPYATAGEVPIDASPERKPRETIEKMKVIQRAALAPGDPSGPDRAVHARAVQLEQQAQQQLNAETAEARE